MLGSIRRKNRLKRCQKLIVGGAARECGTYSCKSVRAQDRGTRGPEGHFKCYNYLGVVRKVSHTVLISILQKQTYMYCAEKFKMVTERDGFVTIESGSATPEGGSDSIPPPEHFPGRIVLGGIFGRHIRLHNRD